MLNKRQEIKENVFEIYISDDANLCNMCKVITPENEVVKFC